MLSQFNVSMIVLAAVLTATFNPLDAAARTRNAAAAAAATQDTDKPAPDSAEAKAYKQKRLDDDQGAVAAHVQELARGLARSLSRDRRGRNPSPARSADAELATSPPGRGKSRARFTDPRLHRYGDAPLHLSRGERSAAECAA